MKLRLGKGPVPPPGIEEGVGDLDKVDRALQAQILTLHATILKATPNETQSHDQCVIRTSTRTRPQSAIVTQRLTHFLTLHATILKVTPNETLSHCVLLTLKGTPPLLTLRDYYSMALRAGLKETLVLTLPNYKILSWIPIPVLVKQ